jgi:hypothetical protein
VIRIDAKDEMLTLARERSQSGYPYRAGLRDSTLSCREFKPLPSIFSVGERHWAE